MSDTNSQLKGSPNSYNHSHSNKKEDLNEMRKLFNEFDINKDKKIDKNELKILVTNVFKNRKNISELKFKEEITIDNTVNKILKKTDSDKNGVITFEEFKERCQCKHFDEIVGKIKSIKKFIKIIKRNHLRIIEFSCIHKESLL